MVPEICCVGKCITFWNPSSHTDYLCLSADFVVSGVQNRFTVSVFGVLDSSNVHESQTPKTETVNEDNPFAVSIAETIAV